MIFMIEAEKELYRGHWDAAYSDEEGRYGFKFIPPGRYVLLIRFDGMTSQNRPFPKIYYSGVSDKSQAKVFAISEGQRIENYDLEVPPLPQEYEIQGKVIWSNGKPAVGARIGYSSGEDSVSSYSVKADDEGRFSFKSYEGLKLTMNAYIEHDGKHLFSNAAHVTVNSSLTPIELILTAP